MAKIMLCQFSNDVINPDSARTGMKIYPDELFYDSIWNSKEQDGYWRPEHFWELPKWIGEVTYAFKNSEHDVCLHVFENTGAERIGERDLDPQFQA